MKLAPIDTLNKLIANLVLWWIGGIFGNACVLILTSSIVNFPESDIFIGLNLVRPIGLIAIDAYIIWQNIKDIQEYRSFLN